MTLRARLSLFFVLIVVVPLSGAIVAVAVLIPRELDERAFERLRGAASGAATLRSERLDRAARDVARIARGIAAAPSTAIPARLESARRESGLDFLVLGSAASMRTPRFLGSAAVAAAVDAPSSPGAERASATIPGRGTLHGGWFADALYAKRIEAETGVGVAVRSGSATIAAGDESVARIARDAPLRGAFRSGGMRGVVLPVGGNDAIVLIAPRPGGVGDVAGALGVIAFAGLLLACALGFALARALSRPLAELAAGANEMAAGNLSVRVRARGHDEVSHVAKAFNTMAAGVQSTVAELRSSRDELRHTLERLGATLRSTRGMEEMLGAVLEAAATTLGAQAGALFRTGPDGSLSVEASIGLEAPQTTREAASEAVGVLRPVLRPGYGGHDPLGRTVVAAPLHRGADVIGVLALSSAGIEPFDDRDLTTLSSFAAQASVAIDNVFLREEAERLALTDALTSVPNRRALERILSAEVERTRRYDSRVSVLMIDLDHFKTVNDRFGHLDGDRVLVETCARVASVVRNGIDVLTRYGGEEFVLVLPETPLEGAVVVAEKVRAAIAGAPFPVAGGLRVTASVGVASTPGDGPGVSDVLHAADLALYRAKEQGRNRVVATREVQEVRR